MTDIVARLQEQSKGILPGTLGMEFLEAAPERVKAALAVRPEICTIGGMLHGGAIMAFADTLGAVATLLNLSDAGRTTTIESKTNFLGAAPAGTRIIGECVPIHRGRTTMVWQTQVKSESGKLLAMVIQTQLVLSA
jgi:uncharacterized protein (TIGR00369 family)